MDGKQAGCAPKQIPCTLSSVHTPCAAQERKIGFEAFPSVVIETTRTSDFGAKYVFCIFFNLWAVVASYALAILFGVGWNHFYRKWKNQPEPCAPEPKPEIDGKIIFLFPFL